jgi:K+-transporting ATPase A subunit
LSSFWLILKQRTIKISSPLFSIFSLVAILVGSREHRTQIWKGAIQGPFHQSLVQIGPVASEELIKMWKVNGRTTDDSGDNSSPDHQILKVVIFKHSVISFKCSMICRWPESWNFKTSHFQILYSFPSRISALFLLHTKTYDAILLTAKVAR